VTVASSASAEALAHASPSSAGLLNHPQTRSHNRVTSHANTPVCVRLRSTLTPDTAQATARMAQTGAFRLLSARRPSLRACPPPLILPHDLVQER
jgi:hypothetical protein